jgi:hypothetical protein
MDTSQDRRQFGRRPFQARVTISLPAHQVSVEANVLDISPDGVRLICAEPVSRSEDVVITFEIKCHTRVQIEEIPGCVIHVRMDDDVWVIGVKFKQALDRRSTPLLAQAVTSRDPALTSTTRRSTIIEVLRSESKA